MSSLRGTEPSDHVDERQLEIARETGDDYQAAVEYLLDEVANTGSMTRAGDYLVGFAQMPATGQYRMVDGRFEWKEASTDENCYLAVFVADAADGRFLPHLRVHTTITSDNDPAFESGREPVPFVWHPAVFQYGQNLSLPGDGAYTVAVAIEPAPFIRHDRTNGHRYTEPVEVRFEGLPFTTSRQ